MTNEQLVALWLHGRPATTQRAYRRVINSLAKTIAKPLAAATLEDLQRHASTVEHLAVRSQALVVDCIRSFFAFHAKVGMLPTNPAAALAGPRIPTDLTDRILTEDETLALIAGADAGPERLMLRLLYIAGLRASELCGLRWRHVGARADGGQITVTGKGGKTRTVLIPGPVFAELVALRAADAKPGDPVFRARTKPGPIAPRQLLDVVKHAAARAGLTDKVSCHWLRHAHASHSLTNGAPLSLVRDTLGHSSVATTNKYLHARPDDGSARYLRTGS